MAADEIAYKNVPLFGGAITCDLPENFADISNLRQVPDYQEAWIDKNGFTSIVIELLDRLEPKKDISSALTDQLSELAIDGAALTEHLMDVAREDADNICVRNTTETEFNHHNGVAAYTLFAVVTPPAKGAGGDRDDEDGREDDRENKEKERQRQRDAPALTVILLTLLRLKREKTDIVIAVNVPHVKGEYDEADVDLELGKTGTLIGSAINYTSRIWETFHVKDYRLFGADGER